MKILVTGGASGLGESITKRLSQEEENTVYFTYSSSEKNAIKITSSLKNTVAIKCDFKNTKDIEELCNILPDLDIDVLINNAYVGEFTSKHFHKTYYKDFTESFIHNIESTLRITLALLPLFRNKKNGKIITILTEALVNVSPIGTSIYTANKAYLKQMCKSWATENSKFNITSNSVSPSLMKTNLTEDIDDRVLEGIIQNHPLKKLLTTEEVADTVAFLCESSSHINGVDIVINSAQNLN